MNRKLILCLLLATAVLLAGCTEEDLPDSSDASGNTCSGTCMTEHSNCNGNDKYGDFSNCKSTEFCCIETDTSSDREAVEKYKEYLR